MARVIEVGVVLPVQQLGPERTTRRWLEIQEMALLAEELGFDTVWIPDELLWQSGEGREPSGFWDGVSLAGAVAAVTSTVAVGTWVLSALHRNAGIIAKTAETLDEISGGRFIFGLGAGHEWPGQARAFGLPETQIFDRYEEALKVILPLVRGGRADVEGQYHTARELVQAPRGPRPGGIPVLMGGNGPRAIRLAAEHADIFSCYVEKRSHVEEFRPRIEALERACEALGRDPAGIGRSAGVHVNPFAEIGERPQAISGSPAQIAEYFRSFADAGFTSIELMGPSTPEDVEQLAEVLPLLEA